MSSAAGWKERRQENRIPLNIPVTMRVPNGEETFSGSVCDISRNGLRAKFPGSPAVPEGKEIGIGITAHDREIEAVGNIRWSRRDQDHTDLGLRLKQPLDLALPLPDVIDACSMIQGTFARGGFPRPQSLLQEILGEFFPYTFAGMFFWNFSDLIHSKHTYASGVTSLASFRIKQFLEALAANGSSPEIDSAGLQKSIDDLDQVVSLLKNLSSVYRLLKDKFSPRTGDETALVDVSALVEQSVRDMEWIASQLNDESHPSIRHEGHPPALLCASTRAISQCLDAIMLFTFLNTLLGGGSSLLVSLASDERQVLVRYANDGSRMLNLEHVRIRPLDRENPAPVPALDRKSILWLHAGLVPLWQLGAEITVRSESGHNEITLKMSQSLDRKRHPAPLEDQPSKHRENN